MEGRKDASVIYGAIHMHLGMGVTATVVAATTRERRPASLRTQGLARRGTDSGTLNAVSISDTATPTSPDKPALLSRLESTNNDTFGKFNLSYSPARRLSTIHSLEAESDDGVDTRQPALNASPLSNGYSRSSHLTEASQHSSSTAITDIVSNGAMATRSAHALEQAVEHEKENHDSHSVSAISSTSTVSKVDRYRNRFQVPAAFVSASVDPSGQLQP